MSWEKLLYTGLAKLLMHHAAKKAVKAGMHSAQAGIAHRIALMRHSPTEVRLDRRSEGFICPIRAF